MERLEQVKQYLKQHKRRTAIILGCLLLYGFEEEVAWLSYASVSPFPQEDYWLTIADSLLRDVFLLLIAGILYFRRSRLKDRLQRYFPAVVLGVGYLAFAVYMMNKLELDFYFLTCLAIFTGLNNNVVPVLLAAMCYHRDPVPWMKGVYFVVYLLCAFLMLVDVVYFWQCSMHVQSVFFRNLNVYAVKGVMSSFSLGQGVALAVALVVLIALFRVTRPSRHKPNFVWSLLCVAGFTMALNLAYFGASQGVLLALKGTGLWSQEQVEKSRQDYRDNLATPIALNIAEKGLLKKEKAIRSAGLKPRTLTAADERIMHRLGVMRRAPYRPLKEPAYDRIVMIIFESVHRDYLHHYNPEQIPAEATPFLDSLIARYPHIDNYYSSAIPTTEGLNATFRSQLLFDNDIDGEFQPSLFRSGAEKGYDSVFLGASSKFYNNEFKEYTEQFGMKTYLAKENLEKMGYTGASGWGYHNDVMYDATLKLLKEYKDKRVIFVTKTLDMHQPYPYYATTWNDTPESFQTNETVTIHGMYWVDNTLKRLFEGIKQAGLFDDRTLFVITSDHNPHSGGEYTKLVAKEADRQAIAPIPLIFVAKNLGPLDNLRTAEYASQIDLAPTLLCLMGIEPPKKFIGRNLLQQYSEPDNALGFFGNKAFYFSKELNFVDKIDEPYPQHDYEDSLANFVMYSYYRSSVKE